MSRRVLIRLRQSILGEAIRLYLGAQPGVDVVGGGMPGADLLVLRPDVILIDADGTPDVPAYLGTLPGARVIAFTGDDMLTVYRKDEVRVAKLDDLLHAISAG
jgi:hypothetical protein